MVTQINFQTFLAGNLILVNIDSEAVNYCNIGYPVCRLLTVKKGLLFHEMRN